MGSAPKPPAVPDPGVVSEKQLDYNKQASTATQAGSMVDQTTPFGNLTYSQRGVDPTTGVPLWSASTSLNSDQQRLLDILTGSKTTSALQGNKVLSDANYGGTSAKDFVGGYTSGLTKEMLDKEVGYLDPYFHRDQDYLDTKLKNQGLDINGPAYKSAMDALHQSQGGIVTNFMAQAQPTAFNQAMQLYDKPLTTAQALMMGGAPTQPTFQTTPNANVQPPNYVGATANAQDALQKNYQSQMSQYGNMMSGMFGIPTALLGGWAGKGFPGASSALSGLGGLFGAGDAAASTVGLGALAELGPLAMV